MTSVGRPTNANHENNLVSISPIKSPSTHIIATRRLYAWIAATIEIKKNTRRLSVVVANLQGYLSENRTTYIDRHLERVYSTGTNIFDELS